LPHPRRDTPVTPLVAREPEGYMKRLSTDAVPGSCHTGTHAMTWARAVVLALLAGLPVGCIHSQAKGPEPDAGWSSVPGPNSLDIKLQVVETRREVVVLAGPFHVPPAGDEHAHASRTPLIEFDWPVDGWIRGFRITAYDATGQHLPRTVMHHLIAYNFARRQLVHAGVERLFAIGAETPDIVLPPSVGVPLAAGSRLGFDAVWHNETGEELHGVYLRVAMVYTPARPKGIAFEGYPIHVDVNYSVTGSNEFDIPPGRSKRSFEFVMPLSGRLIGIGGHLHEHGVSLELEDSETGRVLFRLGAVPNGEHGVTVPPKVFRKWFGLRDARMRLEAGHRYRLVSEYDNTGGTVIEHGAMAHIAGLFQPDNATEWPALDPNDPEIREDLAILRGEMPRKPSAHGH
jgi:hypothetical protein